MASLPSLSQLGLDVRPAAPTDLIVSLEQKDVDALNADGEVCPITQEQFEVGQGVDSENPTFGVQKRGRPVGEFRYYYGRALYNWVRRMQARGLDPTDPIDTGHRIDVGDINELNNRFGRSFQVELDTNITVVREGVIGPRPVLERHYPPSVGPDGRPKRAFVRYYAGVAGKERMVRDVLPHPVSQTVVYEGEQGRERKVSRTFANGYVQHYEGPKGNESLVSIRTPDGTVAHYTGEKDNELKTHETHPDGSTVYYTGPLNEECKVRTLLPDGETQFFEGPRRCERMTHVQKIDGQVWYYTGRHGFERKTRVEDTVAGTIQYYEGEKGREVPAGRLVRMRNAETGEGLRKRRSP